MTPEHLQQIKEREAKAAGSSWIVAFSQEHRCHVDSDPYTRVAENFLKEENATFVAHAREDIPNLIADVEQLQSQLATALQDISRLTAENVRLVAASGATERERADKAVSDYADFRRDNPRF